MFVNQNADAYDRKMDTYIVAYIDLLGMTNRIKGTDRLLVMNKLYNLYTFSIKLTKDIRIEKKIRIFGLKFSLTTLLLQKACQQKWNNANEILEAC